MSFDLTNTFVLIILVTDVRQGVKIKSCYTIYVNLWFQLYNLLSVQ